MSDIKERQASNITIFRTNRDKLIEVLLNEITFLDQCFYKTESINNRSHIQVALEMLENLLRIQGYVETQLSDCDYEDMVGFVYHTISNVANKLL